MHTLDEQYDNKLLIDNVQKKIKELSSHNKGELVIKFQKFKHKQVKFFISSRAYPEIHITDHFLHYNSAKLNLTNKDQILKVFKCFLNSKDLSVHKHKLIEEIYDIKLHADQSMSPRYISTLNHNIIKLISRTRSLANTLPIESRHEWFPYMPKKQKWHLFRLNSVLEENLPLG